MNKEYFREEEETDSTLESIISQIGAKSEVKHYKCKESYGPSGHFKSNRERFWSNRNKDTLLVVE